MSFMEQYALYTGELTNLIHFDTNATGWVFSTGAPFDTGFYTFISAEKAGSAASLVDLVDNDY